MKRAIYLDDQERDLARRVLWFVVNEFQKRIDQTLVYGVDKVAVRYTRDELIALVQKFEEPAPKDVTLRDAIANAE